MSTAPRISKAEVPPLYTGDRMSQAEFHRRYAAYPEDAKFELIGGIVYMASPLRRSHGRWHLQLGILLESYASATPGVEALDNTTTILGDESEPQPDLALRILSEYGGRSRETEDHYVLGPPELIVEVAHSTRAIDMHQKRLDYQRAGVREYLVFCVEEPEVHGSAFGRRTGSPQIAKASTVRVCSPACGWTAALSWPVLANGCWMSCIKGLARPNMPRSFSGWKPGTSDAIAELHSHNQEKRHECRRSGGSIRPGHQGLGRGCPGGTE